MRNRYLRSLSLGKKILLAVAGLMAVGTPIVVGVMASPPSHSRPRVLPAAAPVTAPLLALAASPPAPQQPQAPQTPAAVTAPKQSAPATEPLSPASLGAQTPAFEVATVKPNHSGSGRSFAPALRRGTFSAENVTLKTLLGAAYGVQTSRIAGPEWIDSDRFDITAKPPEGVPDSQVMPMLQSLLKERFLLAVHRETKEMPAYDMVAAKGGVKIRAYDAEHPPAVPKSAGGAMIGGTTTMSGIADSLARVVGRPVVDRTGMEGNFYFMLNYAQLSAQPPEVEADPGPPNIFTAVQEQLGLKLESNKEPVEILMVDHAERVPTPN